MSVTEVTISKGFEKPIDLGAESHMLARMPFEGEVCIAGIRAVLDHEAPRLDWAMKTSSGIILPEVKDWHGHLMVSEVSALDLDPSVEIEPVDILELPRVANADKLIWTKASMVYGVVKAKQARLDYR